MQAIIKSLNYISGDSYVESGFKRGQYPDAPSYTGGNGTYRVFYRADIEMRLAYDKREFGFYIGDDVRRIRGVSQLRRSFFEKLVAVVRCNPHLEVTLGEDKKFSPDQTDLARLINEASS